MGRNLTKYIFVTGGVTSSLGKGIISSSLGRLLVSRGYSVTIQNLDPYINIDPGPMNPYEHGECYVTDDGAETHIGYRHLGVCRTCPREHTPTLIKKKNNFGGSRYTILHKVL